MNRTEILTNAEKIVNGEREQQYGTPEDSFNLIAELWSAYLNSISDWGCALDVGPVDVANMMILLKIARSTAGFTSHADNFIDIAGYAACGGEIATKHFSKKETNNE